MSDFCYTRLDIYKALKKFIVCLKATLHKLFAQTNLPTFSISQLALNSTYLCAQNGSSRGMAFCLCKLQNIKVRQVIKHINQFISSCSRKVMNNRYCVQHSLFKEVCYYFVTTIYINYSYKVYYTASTTATGASCLVMVYTKLRQLSRP